MHIIKPCPHCGIKLRFPIDSGVVKVRCRCGYSFLADPDDPQLYADATFDLSLKKKPKTDMVVSLSSPPFINVFVSLACGRINVPFAHWFMDVYPEALFAGEILSKNGIWGNFLKKQMKKAVNNARLVLTISPEMGSAIASLNDAGIEEMKEQNYFLQAAEKIYWTWLWEDEFACRNVSDEEIKTYREKKGWRQDDVVFMYSGNFGRGHIIRDFLEATVFCEDKKIKWVFAGDGVRKHEITDFISLHPHLPVQLDGYCSTDELALRIKSADVHLASVAEGWENIISPSKIQNIFAAGKPVIFIGKENTELSRLISKYDCGWLTEPGDMITLKRAVMEALNHDVRAVKGKNAFFVAQKFWDRKRQLEKIKKFLESCCDS